MNLDKWDLRFLAMASLVASWSKDPSTKTGAVLTDHQIVLGVGFNGFPRAMQGVQEDGVSRDEKYSRIVHCEVNAAIFARPVPLGATLYTWPFLSCDRCAVQMLQMGVRRFVAPRATTEQADRWEVAFRRTRQYIEECGGTVVEVPRLSLGLPDETAP